MFAMTGVEDETLLKLKVTSTHAKSFACHSHQNECTLSYNLLWHDRFEYIKYDKLFLLKNNSVYIFSTILRKPK